VLSRALTPLRIALLIAIAMSTMLFRGCLYLDLSDLRAMDYRLLQRGPITPGDEVLIVAVDNASLARIGRWPWPRSVVAHLIERIDSGKPAVIGLDAIFTEPSAFADQEAISAKPAGVDASTWDAAQRAAEAQDHALAAALRSSGRVVGGYFFSLEGDADAEIGSTGSVPSTYDVVRGSPGGVGEQRIDQAVGVQNNLPIFADVMRGFGFFNVSVGDGMVRRLPLVVRHHDEMAVPLSLAMLRARQPDLLLSVKFQSYGVESLHFGATDIPVSESGELFINYRGPGYTFRHVSAADVLAPDFDVSLFHDKMIVFGVTATAVGDIRVTPFDDIFPGVEVHANVIDNVLRGDFLRRPRFIVVLEIAVLFIFAIFLGVLLGRVRGIWAAIIAVGLLGLYVAGSQQLFVSLGLELTIVYPLLTIVAIYSAIALLHFVTEERERKKMRRALELYLSPSMARLVSDHPELLKLGGEKQELTVFFSDIRGFTTISEQLDPTELVELLNEYLEEMTEIVFAHEGMLDKYIGDAVMAVWGAPLEQPDHASRACQAALQMVERLEELNTRWQERGWPRLDIGIGLNTGPMVFGNMGSSKHLSLTVMGDNVNLASRLEGLNKMLGTHAIVSEATARAAGEAIRTREIDRVRVKGKSEPVGVFELLSSSGQDNGAAAALDAFASGLAAYRARRWDEAEACFAQVLRDHPGDGPALLHLERCRILRASPPHENWDGVTVMDTK